MIDHSTTVSTEFHGVDTEAPEIGLFLEQKPFPRDSGDILTMDQIAEANGWEFIRILGGGTAMSSDFNKIVKAYYAQCGKNSDGSISTVIYVFKSPTSLKYRLVVNNGILIGEPIKDYIEKEDSITFKLETSVDLGYEISSVESIEWDGGFVYSPSGSIIQVPNPKVSGTCLVVNQVVYGTARIKYKVFGDIWNLNVPMREDSSYQATVLAFYGDNQVKTLEVSFPNLSDLCNQSMSVCIGNCGDDDDPDDPIEEGPIPIEVYLEPKGNGCEEEIRIGLEFGCPEGTPDIEWDDAYSDDTIVPSGTANVGVKEGYPPFIWSLTTGFGYTLDSYETSGRTNVLHADSDACGDCGIQVTDMCAKEANGNVEGPASDLEYDYVNSGQTVARNDSVVIYITGGSYPFEWEISGVGFSIHDESTFGRQNTVYTDNTSCGVATITITDICGKQITGEVRCTVGQWVVVPGTPEELAGYLSGVGYCSGFNWIELIQGKYKMRENIMTVCQSVAGMPCPGDSCMSPWQLVTSIYADKTMDCFVWRTVGCGNPLFAGVKDGLCCWHTSSNVKDRQGVFQRFVWEWVC